MPTSEAALRDQSVILLISGMSAGAVETFCTNNGATPAQATAIVADARKRITLAADYARDEQIGRAITRLEDLYAKSVANKDVRTALQAQRELNKLLGLYSVQIDGAGGAGAEDGGESKKSLELIAGYLLPLELADANYPVEEHARLAADFIRRCRGSDPALT